jgi:hypothetical protein
MYCNKCGNLNDDNAARCKSCGEIPQNIGVHPASSVPAMIPNFMVQAILVTLFCCLPFGIPAIIFASQVNGKIQCGDLPGALAASKNAKTWVWIAFGIGFAALLIGFVVGLIIPFLINSGSHSFRRGW